MAVIEIDQREPWLPPPARRRRAPVALVLAALVAVLNGPWPSIAGGLAVAWRADVVGGFFWLTDDAAYTIDRDGSAVALSRRDPSDGTPQWTVELTGPLAESYTHPWETMVSRFPPTLNLDVNTTVIDTRTGDAVRAYPAAEMPLVYLAADVAVTIDRDPAGGPEPPLPPLSLADTGGDRAHLAVGRDVVTGRVRWTLPLPPGTSWSLPGVPSAAEGIVALPPGQAWMVTATAAGALRVWDLRTGQPISSSRVGRAGRDSYVAALESTVLVRTDVAGRATLITLDPRTLMPLWRLRPPAIYATAFECGELLCLQTDRAVWAVDQAGAVVWRLDPARLRPPGSGRLLVATFGEPLALVDPGSGTPRPADTRWRVVDLRPVGGAVVLARAVDATSAEIGLLDPVAATVTRLGVISGYRGATQCLAAGGRLACEDSGTLRVWT